MLNGKLEVRNSTNLRTTSKTNLYEFKKYSIVILACFAGLSLYSFCSSSNTNGWSVYIGKEEILGSPKNNRGDTAFIKSQKINTRDTLFIMEFICGGTIKPPQVGLRITIDNEAFAHLELTYNRGVNFYPLSWLEMSINFKKLTIEIYSSYNHYYPKVDKSKPMAILIFT